MTVVNSNAYYTGDRVTTTIPGNINVIYKDNNTKGINPIIN